MKVALYARYSSDSQRDASIADQLRVCRAHAERQGWHIVEEYASILQYVVIAAVGIGVALFLYNRIRSLLAARKDA